MEQDVIWDYYQNENPTSFIMNRARMRHLAKLTRPGEKVLNIGVGEGLFEELALARGADIHTLDPVERSILALRDRLKLGEKAQVGYSQAMPFADASFDAVFASEVLEHLSDEVLARSLVEIARVLRPGGRFIGTVPSREDLAALTVVCPHCGERFHRWGHQQSFDPKRIRQMLSSDFEVQSVAERPFISWEGHNWRGRLAVTAKLIMWRLGMRISDARIIFKAVKR